MTKHEAALLATATVGGALIAGSTQGPQHLRSGLWYAWLRKPSYTPPGPAFGIAWTILGGMLAFSGYRLLIAKPKPARTGALWAWGLSALGIAAYPWSFFGRRTLVESSAVAGGMLAATTALAVKAGEVDRSAARAVWPLVAWVSFAFLLSEEIARRNR